LEKFNYHEIFKKIYGENGESVMDPNRLQANIINTKDNQLKKIKNLLIEHVNELNSEFEINHKLKRDEKKIANLGVVNPYVGLRKVTRIYSTPENDDEPVLLEKSCSGCKEILKTESFHICNSSSDGYDYNCKSCKKQYYKENNICTECHEWTTTNKLCRSCNPNNNQKLDEIRVKDILQYNTIRFECNECLIGTVDGDYRRVFPDYMIKCANHMIVLEVDEHAHQTNDPNHPYSYLKEKNREDFIRNQIAIKFNMKTIFIRYKLYLISYNPTVNTNTVPQRIREAQLIETIRNCQSINPNENEMKNIYLFYPLQRQTSLDEY
jgi:hypothetical protein